MNKPSEPWIQRPIEPTYKRDRIIETTKVLYDDDIVMLSEIPEGTEYIKIVKESDPYDSSAVEVMLKFCKGEDIEEIKVSQMKAKYQLDLINFEKRMAKYQAELEAYNKWLMEDTEQRERKLFLELNKKYGVSL